MSKILEASCVSGVVTAELLPVTGTEILSEGVGASTGILILDQDKATYVAKTSPDLEATILQVIDALDAIASALTSIGAFMLGPATAPPPTLPADVALINAAKAQLDILKDVLK